MKLFKKFNIKTNSYKHVLNINNISKISDNKYVANVTYSVEFKVNNNDFVSKSSNEKYRVELICENNRWYVTKLIDINSDEDNTENGYKCVNIFIKAEKLRGIQIK